MDKAEQELVEGIDDILSGKFCEVIPENKPCRYELTNCEECRDCQKVHLIKKFNQYMVKMGAVKPILDSYISPINNKRKPIKIGYEPLRLEIKE